jgi:P-type Cu+ transporter
LAIHLSKRTLRHIYLNYFWAMGYNTVMIPLAAGALYPPLHWALPPWLAGAAMAASSLCVVGCSLLLRRYKRPPRVLRSLACPQPQVLVTGL